jgi:RNA-binding protein 39
MCVSWRAADPGPEADDVVRDQRTVFCSRLAQRLTARQLADFFMSVGKVRDARLVLDKVAKRHKG